MAHKKSQLTLAKFDKANLLKGRHILIVESLDSRRAVALNTSVFSIGRHPHNALVLSGDMVSRHHATVAWLRYTEIAEHAEKNDYCYWIIDGKGKRQRSRNGIYINGQKKSLHRLKSGDLITIGRGKEIKLTYNYISYSSDTHDFLQYCDSEKPQYNSKTENSYSETIIFNDITSANRSN
ncbi:MAG: FHA domain-containing protein [Xenococcaceae cyanobacterium MO_234.B1]|nr:FHA domain-containing protein [Xenococcaceae cyanobacterium MO_234.B1]